MNIPGTRRKLNGLRYCSKHYTNMESFDIPWINCDRIKKITKATIKVFVSENDTPSSSSVSPSVTVGCSLDNNNLENDVSEILIEMSNMNENGSENIVGNSIINETDQPDLPTENDESDELSD